MLNTSFGGNKGTPKRAEESPNGLKRFDKQPNKSSHFRNQDVEKEESNSEERFALKNMARKQAPNVFQQTPIMQSEICAIAPGGNE